MTNAVIIEQSVTHFVEHSSAKSHLLFVTHDIIEILKDLLHRYETTSCNVLLFLSPGISESVLKFIYKQKNSQAMYSIILISPNGKTVIPAKKDLYYIQGLRTSTVLKKEFQYLVKDTFYRFAQMRSQEKKETESNFKLIDTHRDQQDLINIGRALSVEKNPDRLFRKILTLSQKITGADAGTIYLVEETAEGGKQIRVKYANTWSRDIQFEEAVLPFNTKTIAGYVAHTGEVLNIPDVYKLTPDDPVGFNPRFDREHNYITKSMLVVPMRNHRGEIIGVIQLINSKEKMTIDPNIDPLEIKLVNKEDYDNEVVSFHHRYERLLEAVAGQAGVAIENIRMIHQIETQFEEFVRASVFAIESRDEPTSGHSARVAEICIAMAEAINRQKKGKLAKIQFSESELKELKYAALLHDYGKVYLDLRLFQKAKKLYPEEFVLMMRKLDLAYKSAEIRFLNRELALLQQEKEITPDSGLYREIEQERSQCLSKIQYIREKIQLLNEPSVISETQQEVLRDITDCLKKLECHDIDGKKIDLFSKEIQKALSIERGSLTAQERREIQDHVEHTYNFVSKIPWPKELADIPLIARYHHELLDGSGYPLGLKGNKNIPIQARIMTIADIYDALTAADRPYKKALSLEKALTLLQHEADAGKIDPDLFALFKSEKIWEKITLPSN
ncbi:MAG: GAF domain-containing protein [Spirochaetales bacterium]|nr:GAF domain-containing protein [Spirochaetales bacterium]